MAGSGEERTRTAVERVVREEWGRVLAILVGILGDMELAEDALQDALVSALDHWPGRGVPNHPRAWLLRTARHKAIDRLRRDATLQARRAELELLRAPDHAAEQDHMDATIPDERLRLIFTCCHPALAEQARVALTLKTLGGLTTTEIARAFLVPEITLAQRLVRAKRKIKAAGIPYAIPPPHLWPERLASVLAVIYLVFNEGYAATSGEALTRAPLCREAIRLGRVVAGLAPEEPEAAGLLALMLLHDARRPARTDAEGNLMTLEHQERALWDAGQIAEGDRVLRGALALRHPGPYQLQAAISAVHSLAPTYADTDWREIALIYERLVAMQPTPVVRLNAAVAMAMADGPKAGLAALAELEAEGELAGYQPFHVARAELLRRASRPADAAAAYRQALQFTHNAPEIRYLRRRLEEVGG